MNDLVEWAEAVCAAVGVALFAYIFFALSVQ